MNYSYKWQFKDYPYIKITKDKKVINTQTQRELKRVVRRYSVGYNIGKKFIIITKINQEVELIKTQYYPF